MSKIGRPFGAACFSWRTMDTKRANAIRKKLLAWYAVEARDLPWRRTSDPYAIWVSEIMLQQTRVETVVAYYERFLERFPTLAVLAASEIDDVLKSWEGLGYYRRAHNLHRAARVVVSEHGGSLPGTAKALRALPGIGAYTAPAIASIAFGLDEPVLDGNIVRVLSRLFRIVGDPSKAPTRKALLREAERLVTHGDASHINQALMDLGARICLSRSPACTTCPLADACDAHHDGLETDYPQKPTRKPIPHRDVVAGAVWDAEPFSAGAKLLIAQRHAEDMLGGLWEFAGGGVEQGETLEEALHRELQEELGIEVEILEPFMEVKHAYSHFRMTLHIFHCRHAGGEPRAIDCADWRWVRVDDLDAFAFPTADRKALLELSRLNASAG